MTAPDQGGSRRTPEDFRKLKDEIAKAVADIDEILDLMAEYRCAALNVAADSLFNTCREKLQYFADQAKMKIAGKLKRGKFEKATEADEVARAEKEAAEKKRPTKKKA